jgi:hypothetical protein
MSKPSIYDQHAAAFASVSAYVIMKDAYRAATIAFKYPRDGAGRLYVYVHWIGTKMVRGHANGYGYDKRSAAAWNAARRIASDGLLCEQFIAAFREGDGGSGWDSALRSAGFTVLQAV